MHILQRKAKRTQIKPIGVPENAVYDFGNGVWIKNNELLSYDPNNERLTKKCDIETGEDQKGS